MAKAMKKTKTASKKASPSKVKVKAKKPTAKKTTSKGKGNSLNSIKVAIGVVEKSLTKAFGTAKQQAQKHAASTMKTLNRCNQDLKKIAAQDKTLQQKLQAAQTKLKTKATTANKVAAKKTQKMWDELKKKQQNLVQELKQTEVVHNLAKGVESKLNFLAKEAGNFAKNWKPEASAKKAPAAEKKAPAAAAKKPAASSSAPKTSAPASKPMTYPPLKPPVSNSQPGQTQVRPPFGITPHNIAQKPLTGAPGARPQDNKPFGLKDDF